ncbi:MULTISPECIES: hypothetical protein [unclassified Polaribacter]|uniref:hypothetical protein n=1 Tax=unclassified Polaribacter TaxID=196858 RepID=UPI0011BE1C91|nr:MULTISPECIES: hypothetical protein [unclassified Polaribacter]TXD54373.1 hypothetical protein ES043_00540 [Polaribacter sp. IC063]TXD62796.1 hypothetical protein ES044_00220 [Polaribacter sp. IC066]
MIKFFGKIRKNLLLNNKVSKYLPYAIGEIALIMIGILLALQVNNQNEVRKSNDLVTTYEQNIALELKTDILRLKEMDSIRTIWNNSLLAYVKYYNSENVDMHILKRKSDSAFTDLRILHTSTYSIQDLISTGNLKLFPMDKKM